MTARPHAERASTSTARRPQQRKWLLFVHQLPTKPSNLRVSTWRRLQQLGAVPLKQAVYVLPDTPGAREDFEWLKTEVQAAGGEASVFAANSIETWSDDALVEQFRRVREEAYTVLANDAEQALEAATSPRQRRAVRAPAPRRLLGTLRERLAAIERIDFFGSAGRDRVIALLKQLEATAAAPARADTIATSAPSRDLAHYRRGLWITRPRPGVDRMASAWLIQRFIDPEARFGFAADRQEVPERGVPFDMFGVEFTHQGDGCTFETLCSEFDIRHPAISRIAGIVHDLDLKDGRFGARECATVGAMIDGLQLAFADDVELLAQGMTLFDSLYRSFEQSVRTTGPRPVAKRKKSRKRRRS